MKLSVGLFALAGAFSVDAFVPPSASTYRRTTSLDASFEETIEDVKSAFQMRFRIFQESQKEGADFKQSLANVIAGEYDKDAVLAKTKEYIDSAPCVMLTWENSPSCKSAVTAMDSCGYEYSIVRLDDPWSEGNPIRAEVGKMVGKTSVPMVFIGGEYVGGFDSGVSDEAPGLVQLAFKGNLQAKLEAAGAAKK